WTSQGQTNKRAPDHASLETMRQTEFASHTEYSVLNVKLAAQCAFAPASGLACSTQYACCGALGMRADSAYAGETNGPRILVVQ
ncbi:MAG: hypothetical protein SGPRY_002673, partial [Prymnesium sp.]